MTLLTKFDEYNRRVDFLIQADCTNEFLTFVRNQKHCQRQWREAVEECDRLRGELNDSVKKISELEKNLSRARLIIEGEKERAVAAEEERDSLQNRVFEIQNILHGICRQGDMLANETKEKLDRFMNDTTGKVRCSLGEGVYPRLDTIEEGNNTGDFLSDTVSSRYDDSVSLDSSYRAEGRRRKSKNPRKSDVVLDEVPVKRRKSARLSASSGKGKEHLIATTTVTVPHDGPIVAQSRIEARPIRGRNSQPPHVFATPSLPSIAISSSESDAPSTPRAFAQPHDFAIKTILRPTDDCCVCSKNMGFASKAVRCNSCKSTAHVECRDAVPLPCLPPISTPRGDRVPLANQVGNTAPLVPVLVVRCVLEVERRGLNEIGLYRVPGSERDVKALKTRFQRNKGAWSLAAYDINVICGVLKDALRTLPEPLITRKQWRRFADTVRNNGNDRDSAIYQQVSELPAPNRDTLAFLILHLLKVAQSPDCKMTVQNLSTVFGPTIVGYPSDLPTEAEIGEATAVQAKLVESMLELGEDYWRNVLQKAAPATPILTPKYGFRSRAGSKNSKLFGTPSAK